MKNKAIIATMENGQQRAIPARRIITDPDNPLIGHALTYTTVLTVYRDSPKSITWHTYKKDFTTEDLPRPPKPKPDYNDLPIFSGQPTHQTATAPAAHQPSLFALPNPTIEDLKKAQNKGKKR